MQEKQENWAPTAGKWLQAIFYIGIVEIVTSIITLLPFIPDMVTMWISRGLMVAMIVCMFQMSPLQPHYKMSGIFRTAALAATFITAFFFSASALVFAASILSILAVYQEYSGHAELIEALDSDLARKWHRLFYWGFVAGILISFASMIGVVLVVALEMGTASATALILTVLSIPQLIIDVIYLRYLQRMMELLKNSTDM